MVVGVGDIKFPIGDAQASGLVELGLGAGAVDVSRGSVPKKCRRVSGGREYLLHFVVVGVGVVLVGVFLGNAVFGPIAKRAAAAGTDLDAGMIRTLSFRLMAFGVLDFSLLVVAVSVMILRIGV